MFGPYRERLLSQGERVALITRPHPFTFVFGMLRGGVLAIVMLAAALIVEQTTILPAQVVAARPYLTVVLLVGSVVALLSAVGGWVRWRMHEIVVTDRGPGVPETERERVLGRFVRLEASRSEPGSGLGLSLVAAVARLHGGALRLEDNEPGLRVVLSLPLEDEAHINGTVAETSTGAELRPT